MDYNIKGTRAAVKSVVTILWCVDIRKAVDSSKGPEKLRNVAVSLPPSASVWFDLLPSGIIIAMNKMWINLKISKIIIVLNIICFLNLQSLKVQVLTCEDSRNLFKVKKRSS